MKTGLFRTMLGLALSMGVVSAPAFADTVNLTFTQSTVDVTPGGTAEFDATISAPVGKGGSIFLNGDSFTFLLPSGNTVDDNGLFNNFPVLLNPGQSATGELFTVKIPTGVAPGLYNGVYELQGGTDFDSFDVIATGTFTVDVLASTPEPSSLLLLSSGMLSAAAFGLRRRVFGRA
jgi:PEP-CTERM motif